MRRWSAETERVLQPLGSWSRAINEFRGNQITILWRRCARWRSLLQQKDRILWIGLGGFLRMPRRLTARWRISSSFSKSSAIKVTPCGVTSSRSTQPRPTIGRRRSVRDLSNPEPFGIGSGTAAMLRSRQLRPRQLARNCPRRGHRNRATIRARTAGLPFLARDGGVIAIPRALGWLAKLGVGNRTDNQREGRKVTFGRFRYQCIDHDIF